MEPKGSKLSSNPELWLPEEDSLPKLFTLSPSLPDLVVGEPGGDEKSMSAASVTGVLGTDIELWAEEGLGRDGGGRTRPKSPPTTLLLDVPFCSCWWGDFCVKKIISRLDSYKLHLHFTKNVIMRTIQERKEDKGFNEKNQKGLHHILWFWNHRFPLTSISRNQQHLSGFSNLVTESDQKKEKIMSSSVSSEATIKLNLRHLILKKLSP